MRLTDVRPGCHGRQAPTESLLSVGRLSPSARLFGPPARRRPEERVHTRPEPGGFGRVKPSAFHANREEGGIDIPVADGSAVRADMHAVAEGLWDLRTTMAHLRKPGRARWDEIAFSASTFSLAKNTVLKHPGRPMAHRTAELLLPPFLRYSFGLESISDRQEIIRDLSMKRVAMGRLETADLGEMGPRHCHAGRCLPRLVALLDRSVGIVVLRVVRPALTVKMSLEPTDLLLAVVQFFANQLFGRETCFRSDDRESRRPLIQAYDGVADLMLRLPKRLPFADQLREESIPSVEFAADEPDVLDPLLQAVRYNAVIRIDHGLERKPGPFDAALTPADAGAVRLALNGIDLTVFLESGTTGFAKSVSLCRSEHAGSQRLHGRTIQVFPDPRMAELHGVGVEIVFSESMGLVCPCERLCSFRSLGHRPGGLEGLGLSEERKPSEGFSKTGVEDLSGTLEPRENHGLLRGGCFQRKFQDKTRRLGFLGHLLSVYAPMRHNTTQEGGARFIPMAKARGFRVSSL